MHQELSVGLLSLLKLSPAPAVRIVPLGKDSVATLREHGPAVLKVLAGQVWLTETPARGDVVLTAGERFELGRTSPWVIEALSDARLEVRPG